MFNWLIFGAGVAITALVGYGLHSFDVNRLNAKHATELAAQATLINGQCTVAKAITTGVSNGLQINLGVLDADSAAIDRLLPCTAERSASVVASPAAGYDAAAAATKPDERIVRTFEPRRVTAIVKKGEKYRVQLLACQSYVDNVQKAAAGR